MLPALRRRRAPHPKWQWPVSALVLGDTSSGQKIFVTREMRGVHCFTCGASGQGKSKLLESIVRQNILELSGERRATVVIDPHGTLIENTLSWVATHRLHELRTIRVLDPSDPDHLFGMNPCEERPGVDPAVIASAVLNAILTAGWRDQDATAMPLLRQIGKATLYALTALDLTFLEIDDLFDPEDRLGLRQYVIENVRHPSVRNVFVMIHSLPPAKMAEIVGSFERRMNECLLPAAMRRIFAARSSLIRFRQCMDAGDVVLVNLAHGNGRISEDESTLLGCLIVTDIFLSSLGRPEGSTPVDLIIDEAHRFLTSDVANILDQSRKFGLSVTLSTQHLGHVRDRGEHIYRSVMANTRTKIIFGGLDDDDATLMARNLYRGSFDLERAKHRYDRPEVVGQEYDWLRSESESRGSSRAVGMTVTETEGKAVQRSTTESQGRAISETESTSASETLSHSWGTSAAHTDTESGSSSFGSSSATASGRSGSTSQQYDQFGAWIGGPTRTSGWSGSNASGFSRAESAGWGSVETTGTSHATSTAYTTGTSYATSTAASESTATTEGTTVSHERSRGTTITDTQSIAQTTGRAQTLRSIFKTTPSQAYSLSDLVHMASVTLAHLNIGEAVVKIGKRRPVRIKTLLIKEGWATPEHVKHLKRRLAAEAPFVTTLAEARAAYIARRQELMGRLLHNQLPPPAEQAIDVIAPEPTPAPLLKDEGWG